MSLNYQSMTLAVGESRAIHTRGKVFVCDTATTGFMLRIENNAEIPMEAKRVVGSSTSPEFSRVTVRNSGVVPNTIVWAITSQDVQIEKQIASINATVTVAAQKNAPTSIAGSGLQVLTAGNSTGAITNPNGKQFFVRNHPASAGVLQIKDGAGNLMDALNPGDPAWTVETSGTFILTASGGNCTYSWGKVIYT